MFKRRKGGSEPEQTTGADEAVVVVDSLRLMQVLGNLVSNAIKFSRGGRVALLVRCLPPDLAQGERHAMHPRHPSLGEKPALAVDDLESQTLPGSERGGAAQE